MAEETAQPAPQRTAGYSVKQDQAEAFGKVWHHNGVNIILQDSHYKFATDFANVCLRSFIQMCQQQFVAAQKAAAEANKSMVTL
jgi:hypothetical protein